MDAPQPLPNPDFTKLIELCKKHIEFLASADYHIDNDYQHYIYEAATAALYGDGVWAWINKMRNKRNG